MQKHRTLNIGGLIFLVAAVYLTYYLLLRETKLPISIHSVLLALNHHVKHWHALAAGLLPIYMGLMIFGAAILGISFGSALQQWIAKQFKSKD